MLVWDSGHGEHDLEKDDRHDWDQAGESNHNGDRNDRRQVDNMKNNDDGKRMFWS